MAEVRGKFSILLTRRSWLAGWLATAAAAGVALSADDPLTEADAAERDAVAEKAQKTGLGAFQVNTTTHYLGLGDAPASFRSKALQICEGLARDYLQSFQAKGFAVERPPGRMTVILLADREAFARFTGEAQGPAVGGQYEVDSNRLVIFDNREVGPGDPAIAERANLVSLVHEATHQLTFNTGLLRREGDVPDSISEGLAMYAEVRRPSGHTPLGQPNPRRVEELARFWENGKRWRPLAKLIGDDGPFRSPDDEAAQHVAYAQSWLMVDTLMKSAERLPAFRGYLKAIGPRTDSRQRVDDARAHLGDLDALDAESRRKATKLLGRRGSGR